VIDLAAPAAVALMTEVTPRDVAAHTLPPENRPPGHRLDM
jgi:hypothetical protein